MGMKLLEHFMKKNYKILLKKNAGYMIVDLIAGLIKKT